MKAKRFGEEQIIGVRKATEAGAKVRNICLRYGIWWATFYNWKPQYAGMTVSDSQTG